MANPRDFEHPVAAFDVDQSDWESEYLNVIRGKTSTDIFFLVVYKLVYLWDIMPNTYI